jgi:tRNA dimethylallyltransferase
MHSQQEHCDDTYSRHSAYSHSAHNHPHSWVHYPMCGQYFRTQYFCTQYFSTECLRMKNSFPYDYIMITGATGVGKTALSLMLAELVPVEIINADMGQFYVPLNIGTAKPNWQHQATPHHGFALLDEPIDYSVAAYRSFVEETMIAIKQRGALPLIVGGSGFYLRSLLFSPAAYSTLREGRDERKKRFSSLPQSAWWQELAHLDHKRAAAIHPHDSYRIERAVTIWEETGTLPSYYTPTYRSLGKGLIINVTRSRTDLYKIINERVHSMLAAGWVNEVVQLSVIRLTVPELSAIKWPIQQEANWYDFLQRKKIIGYAEIIDYLREQRHVAPTDIASTYVTDTVPTNVVPMNVVPTNVVAKIQQRTRQYAKRQELFLRTLCRDVRHADTSHDVSIEAVNLTFLSLPLYIKQLALSLHIT